MDKSLLDYFGFSCLPFSKALPPQHAPQTESFSEARSRLEYGIKGEDLLLLTGPVGVGKSAVLNAFIHAMDINSYTPLYIRGNALVEGELKIRLHKQ
jgi:type II secretory pathway predicted ATPase ExeA